MAAALSLKNGKWILDGFLPIEELERGLPRTRKKKTQHILLLVRTSPRYLLEYSRDVLTVRITIERRKNADQIQKDTMAAEKKRRRKRSIGGSNA